MKKKLLLTLTLLIGVFTMNAQDIYVDLNATGNNDGTDWANAYINLDTALANYDVVSSWQIKVAQGVYKPGNGSDRDAYFHLSQGCKIAGSYDASTGVRDIHTFKTILSGDLVGDDNGTISENEPTRQDILLQL